MAYIQEKVKKIVSFKFRVCVGQDAVGKQVFKCKIGIRLTNSLPQRLTKTPKRWQLFGRMKHRKPT